MSDVVTVGDATLVHGDARSYVGSQPDNWSVDCLVSDPPYELTYGGHHGSLGGKLSSDVYDNKGGIVDCDIEWTEIAQLAARSVPRGHIYLMANNRHVGAALNAAEGAGLRFHNLLVWDKGTGTPNRWYMKNCEFTLFLFKGKARFINDCGSRQLVRCPNIIGSEHPTEKPVALMRHYIENSTQPGDLVFDPFMGSGSTAVACIQSGRRFIGCEIDRKYFDLACRRVGAASNYTPSLFGGAA